MIGIAAIGNPWIFKEVIHYLQTGEKLKDISNEEKLKTILRHIDMEVQEKGEKVAIREMRKHIAWYVKGLKDATIIREQINKIETQHEMTACLTEYFNDL